MLVDGTGSEQVGTFEHVLAEFADRQARPVQGHGWNDRIDPAAVGQARVDHRRRFVQPAPERCKDALHDALDVLGIDETQVGLLQLPGPLDEHPVRSVDQNLGDTGVTQQHLQRPEPGQLVDQFFGQALHFVA
ncbi:hypothetical protein D3C79_616440 [compost metagenome]